MHLEKFNKKLFVQLASCFDEGKAISYSQGQKLFETNRPYGNLLVEVDNIHQAGQLCIDFINYYQLGSSNWTGGNVFDENNNFVARVSYNGRIWDKQDWKISNEIKLN